MGKIDVILFKRILGSLGRFIKVREKGRKFIFIIYIYFDFIEGKKREVVLGVVLRF